MKRKFKAILSGFCAAVFALSLTTSVAFAAPADNSAFIAFADSAWANSYWGEGDANNAPGVVATTADVTGVGQYTVGLDFTGTDNGYASGVVFTAPMIQSGEANYPGYFMQIDEIKINGEAVELTKGYTKDEDGRIRYNVYNTFETDFTKGNGRSLDGDLSNVSATIVDPELFKECKTYEITFTLLDAEGNGPAAAEDTATTDTAAADTAATDTAATDTAATDTTATATDTAATTDVPKTGVVGLGLVYGLGAIATGAAVLKRKGR